ncbi:hypothetical protein SAMN04487949_1394 [Halogranum gelatinilyticum]|uniref:Uncharacterized protein n=1 Tax=Halogranum gelatinilyticum TaxID=660521 RepID=A0A1G9SJQ8_9EURY|nr:hypothetical protein [Halogranum gelatinilyticum]SDM35718.1 hypothetical protein SAMN04487949_1394 [Halogranum gelatinilyticum]
MKPSTSVPESSLLLAFLVGVLLTSAVGLVAFDVQPANADRGPDPTSPPHSYSYGGGSCTAPEQADTGWAHEVATGTSRTFTANFTVVHDADEELNVSFDTHRPGVYVLDLSVVERDDRRGSESDSSDCTTASILEFAASLPTDYERVELRVDGETVETVENDGDTGGELWQFAWNESTQQA